MIQFHLLLIFACLKTQAQFTGDLRLVDSISTNARGAGRLEIFVQGQWGTVCDDFIDLTTTDVACRQLGYPSAGIVGNVQTLHFPAANTSTRIWLDDVSCSSTDTSLLFCSHNGLGNHNCDHWEDVAIVCTGARTRIVRGADINGTHATTVNRTNITTVNRINPTTFNTKTVSEMNTKKVNGAHTTTVNAAHTRMVASIGVDENEGKLRLVTALSDSDSHGRLEIFLRGEWGTVCDDGFGTTNANVACRQLGYDSASRVGNVGQLGYYAASSETEIWLDDVDCSVFDTTLLSCDHRGIGMVGNCTHSEDVALICSASSFKGTNSAFTGAVTAFLVSVMFILLVGAPTLAYCIHVISKRRNSPNRTQTQQFPTSLTPSAYFLQLEQEYVLHEAPPPYSEINAYPLPALSPSSTEEPLQDASFPTESRTRRAAQNPRSSNRSSVLNPADQQPSTQQSASSSTEPQTPADRSAKDLLPSIRKPQRHASFPTESQSSVSNPADQPTQPSIKKSHQCSSSSPTVSQTPADRSAKDLQPSIKRPQWHASFPTESQPPSDRPAKNS